MKTGKLTVTAMLLSVSFAVSVIEGMIPLNFTAAVPGLKLGFANIAVAAALFMCGKSSAFCVAVLRPFLSFIVFGNVTSFILSLSGGLIAFCSLCMAEKLYGKVFSFCGLSVISAVFHSIGQITAACFVVSDIWIITYLPLLCAASSATGFLTGCFMNTVIPRLISSRSAKNV